MEAARARVSAPASLVDPQAMHLGKWRSANLAERSEAVWGRHAGGGHAAGEPVDRSAPVRRVPWYR